MMPEHEVVIAAKSVTEDIPCRRQAPGQDCMGHRQAGHQPGHGSTARGHSCSALDAPELRSCSRVLDRACSQVCSAESAGCPEDCISRCGQAASLLLHDVTCIFACGFHTGYSMQKM